MHLGKRQGQRALADWARHRASLLFTNGHMHASQVWGGCLVIMRPMAAPYPAVLAMRMMKRLEDAPGASVPCGPSQVWSCERHLQPAVRILAIPQAGRQKHSAWP